MNRRKFLSTGAALLPQYQDRTLAPSAVVGATAVSTYQMRYFQGYGSIQAIAFNGWSRFHSVQGSIQRRLRARARISTTGSVARRDGVIPVAVKRVRRDPQSREHFVGDLASGLIAARVECGLHA